jgi:hypothetical protein
MKKSGPLVRPTYWKDFSVIKEIAERAEPSLLSAYLEDCLAMRKLKGKAESVPPTYWEDFLVVTGPAEPAEPAQPAGPSCWEDF